MKTIEESEFQIERKNISEDGFPVHVLIHGTLVIVSAKSKEEAQTYVDKWINDRKLNKDIPFDKRRCPTYGMYDQKTVLSVSELEWREGEGYGIVHIRSEYKKYGYEWHEKFGHKPRKGAPGKDEHIDYMID